MNTEKHIIKNKVQKFFINNVTKKRESIKNQLKLNSISSF